MQSTELLAKAESLWLELTSELEEPDPFSKAADHLELFQFNLMKTDGAIRELKTVVETHSFQSKASEILFFKEIKPKFISEFIYYSKIIELESTMPKAGLENVRTVIEKELEALKQFALDNRDFIAYLRKEASYLDAQFFLRCSYDLYITQSLLLHSHDERFSTSHDGLVALVYANDKLELYLMNRLLNLDQSYRQALTKEKSPLQWTGSKAALVELLYGLQQTKSLNYATIEFAKVVRAFETCFNIDLGNYHKTLAEIRERKTARVKFLDQMSGAVIKSFEEVEGK